MKKNIIKLVLVVFLVNQFLLIGALGIQPKKAEAFLGIGDFTFNTEIWNPYDILKEFSGAAAKRILLNYSNMHLQNLIQKLQDKFKIKNYLYYDQVVTNFLVSNIISDKISDPDLREIYTLMESAYITGESTGFDQPRLAVIPNLKKKIYEKYIEEGGVPYQVVSDPRLSTSSTDYYKSAQSYFVNHPSYTEQNLKAEFGAFQSEATTAAQLEIIVGKGIKNGRIIGGTCVPGTNGFAYVTKDGAAASELTRYFQTPADFLEATGIDPSSSPHACEFAKATWQPSAVDKARSFIDNPSATVEKLLDSAFLKIFDNNFDADNIWSQAGAFMGNFLFRQFTLGDDGGVLEEDEESAFRGEEYDFTQRNSEMDIDKDGFADGFDLDDDDKLDVCHHGGEAPDCIPSSEAAASPYFSSLCRALESGQTEIERLDTFLEENEFKKSSAQIYNRRIQGAMRGAEEIVNSMESIRSKNFDSVVLNFAVFQRALGKVVESLTKDEDLDFKTGSGDGGGEAKVERITRNFLDYVIAVRTAMNQCDDPNDEAASAVPDPDLDFGEIEIPPPGEGFVECDTAPLAISPDPTPTAQQIRNEHPEYDLANNDDHKREFTARVAYRLWQQDNKWGHKRASSTRPLSADGVGYLRPDVGVGRFEVVDIISGGDGSIQRGCVGVVSSEQVWVQPEPVQ